MIIDNKLNWPPHLNEIKKRCSYGIYKMSKKWYPPVGTNVLSQDVQRAEKLAKKAIRILQECQTQYPYQ